MIVLEKGLKWEKLNLKPEALTRIGAKSMAVDILPHYLGLRCSSWNGKP